MMIPDLTTPFTMPAMPSRLSSTVQRNGAFEMYVGKAEDVDRRLNERKQIKSPYGQLSLSSNVVEIPVNLGYWASENPVITKLSPYLDFENTTRNGRYGQQASFVYPLKMPNQPKTIQANTSELNPEIKIGIYISDEDLPRFLNRVGEEEWNSVVKESPDELTKYALAYVEDVGKDAQGNPIQLTTVSTKTSVLNPIASPHLPQRLNRLA